jgi:Flp pilus assembly protein TadB
MNFKKFPSIIRHNYQFKRFEFKPRYYDEEKENLEKRKRMIRAEMDHEENMKDDAYLERHKQMREKMEDTWRNRRSSETRKSNIRIVIIIAILVAILYVVKIKLGI